MRHSLAIFRVLIGWHAAMRIFVRLGIGVMLAAVIAGLVADEWEMVWPAILLFLPPVMLAPVAFRQLLGSRQTALVPGLRSATVAALGLVPVLGALVIATIGPLADTGLALPPAGALALGSFALLSAYLLLWQWLCTFPAGSFLHLGLVFAGLVIAFDHAELYLTAISAPWPLAGAALIGWVWLWAALRFARRIAPPGKGIDAWSETPYRFGRIADWLPSGHAGHEPIGTLMRGTGTGWIQRIGNVLVFLVGAGSVAAAWFFLLMRDNSNLDGNEPLLIFLWISLLSAACFAPLMISEWPLRIRYLWLRAAGNRAALWRLLERTLAGDMLIVAAVALVIAAGTGLLSDIEPIYLLAYAGGCTLGTLWSCYFGFWLRLTGTSSMVFGTILVLCWSLVLWIVVFMVRAFPPAALLLLLPVLAGLAMHSRFRARAMFLRHDWCAIGPTRRTGNGLRHDRAASGAG